MATVEEIKKELRRMEHLQRMPLSARARRTIVRRMPWLVQANNDAVKERNKVEAEHDIRLKNEVLAKEAFDKLGRGRITRGPNVV